MISPTTTRRALLRLLAAAAPYALPHEQVAAEAARLLRPPPAEAEVREQLTWLLDHSLVDFLPDPLEPESFTARRWLVTEAGLAVTRQ